MGSLVRRAAGVLCMVAGVCMLVCAGVMVWCNQADQDAALGATSEVAGEVYRAIGETAGDALPAPEDIGEPAMPTVQIDGYDYIGYLELPTVGLTLPVMDSWDYDRLKLAPCRYWGATFSDDLVIAAHNYANHFGPIGSMREGDPVQLVDAAGEVWRYRVALIEVVGPYDVEGMVGADWDLTLFTCTQGGANRVAVRCERVLAW